MRDNEEGGGREVPCCTLALLAVGSWNVGCLYVATIEEEGVWTD